MIVLSLMNRTELKIISAYGLTHATIDAACAAVVFSIISINFENINELFNLVIIYNLLAFGSQIIIGYFIDRWHASKLVALAGVAITALSIVIAKPTPLAAVIFAGIGNSLFHAGGGGLSLSLKPSKAIMPGLFVAPGALGLLAGTFVGRTYPYFIWILIPTLVLLEILLYRIKVLSPKIEISHFHTNRLNANLIVSLVLICISIRSLVGLTADFPWKADTNLLILLTIGIVAGKAVGGLAADYLGWTLTAVGGLLLSAPLLTLGSTIPLLAITGIFLFQLTMPVTMLALSAVFPKRPSFSFGLSCLALILGALPVLLGFKNYFAAQETIFALITFSTVTLFVGLGLLKKGVDYKSGYSPIQRVFTTKPAR